MSVEDAQNMISNNPRDIPRIVPGRACGSCMMCCKILRIEELDKPTGVWCKHAVTGKGCGIYDDRPRTCRAFFCNWMRDASLGPEWKPDRAKLVVRVQRNGTNLEVSVDPSFPRAWTRQPYYALIKRWAQGSAQHRRYVFVSIGERTIVVLPDRDSDIGRVGRDDHVIITRRVGPAGLVFDIEVKRGVVVKA